MHSMLRRRPSPSMILSLIALFVALGGTSYAVTKINGKNITKGTIPGDRVKKNSITGTQINESKLATVKQATSAKSADTAKTATSATTAGSATTATTATNATNATNAVNAANATNAADSAKLGGKAASDFITTGLSKRFVAKLAAGDTRELATVGGISVDAVCADNRIAIVGRTSVAKAVQGGDDDLGGGPADTDFLQPDTALTDREIAYNSEGTDGVEDVESEIDQGFVMGPDGSALVINSEGIVLGLNYAGSNCVVAGVIDVLAP